jgi:hypothetical protein
VYATSICDLSIAAAIVVAADTLLDAAVLPIALAYIIQPPLGAVYIHYQRNVVAEGPVPAKPSPDLSDLPITFGNIVK